MCTAWVWARWWWPQVQLLSYSVSMNIQLGIDTHSSYSHFDFALHTSGTLPGIPDGTPLQRAVLVSTALTVRRFWLHWFGILSRVPAVTALL
jgi:hypothetical protein